MEDQGRYHSRRAAAELQLGLTAPSPVVARAHLRFAELHSARVRELDPSGGESGPALPISGL